MKTSNILDILLNTNQIVELYKMSDNLIDPQSVILVERDILHQIYQEMDLNNDKLRYLFLQTDFGAILRQLTIQFLKNQITYKEFEDTVKELIKKKLVRKNEI